MKLLIDTHLLIWAAGSSKQLPALARQLIWDRGNILLFSPASIWELDIKQNLGRADFQVDSRSLRRQLLDNGYEELPITSEHAAGSQVCRILTTKTRSTVCWCHRPSVKAFLC